MRKVVGLMLLSASLGSYAGIAAPTAHSRANCFGNNESITWHLGHSYWWRVESHHYPDGWTRPAHIINTGKNYTWRAAAVHWREGYSTRGDKWYVNGYHFFYPNGKERLDTMTGTNDCSIYDGWWDQ